MAWSPFISALLRPMVSLQIHTNDDDDLKRNGIDIVYPLTAFFAFGIWLVFRRYQQARNKPVPFHWEVPKAADPTWVALHIPNPNLESHLSNPELLPTESTTGRRCITSYDPSTALHIGTFIADNAAEIEAKIHKSSIAQDAWKKTTFADRRRVMRSLLKWLVDNQEPCARVACRDTGKTLIDAALGEILTTCSKAEWIIAHGERALSPDSRGTNMMLSYKKSQVYYEPLGVVAAIVSWNYPLHNAWSPILASIFAGNGVVLKCSEHVIWSSTWFVGAIQACLEACGHDPDLVQIVCCWPEDADALTTSPFIRHITFIGSETVGRKVAQAATKHLTPVTLELGGKDPAVILPGTDIDKWASVWMRGIFQNSGQNCIGIERLIVHSSQYDQLRDVLVERVKKLRFGSVLSPSAEGWIAPVDCGSMISADRFDELERIITEAQNDGARLETGGTRWKHVYLEDGSYFVGTVLGEVTDEMEIANKELFGPIALLMRYNDVEEAIALANETRYGLGASVFGPDQRECVKVAMRLECGMVSVNDFGVFYLNQDLPFGGIKMSGYGRFGGPEGLRSLTNTKAIMVDRWPWLVQTGIPAVLDYPVGSLVQSWDFVRGLITVLYAYGWRNRAQGVVRIVRASSRRS